MANPLRGQTKFVVGGKEYTFRLAINEICELEKETGIGFIKLATNLMDPDTLQVYRLRDVLHAGLKKSHPDLTLEDVGELITEAGGTQRMMDLVEGSISSVFLEADPMTPDSPTPEAATLPNGTGPGSLKPLPGSEDRPKNTGH